MVLRVASGEHTKSEELGYGRQRVRALADRRGDVASRVRSLIFTPARSGLAGTYMPRTIIFSVGIPIPHPDA